MTVLTLRGILLSLLAASSFGLIACGGDEGDDGGDGTFDREGFAFTFDYPEGVEETDEVTIDQALGAQPDETAAVSLDDENALLLQTFTLNVAIDESNLKLAKQEIDGLVGQADPGAASERTKVAGLPALTLDEVEIPSIEEGKSRLTVIFDGDQEYYVNCQYTPERAAEIADRPLLVSPRISTRSGRSRANTSAIRGSSQ